MNDYKVKIYLAGPFFNHQERKVKALIKEHLEDMCALNERYEVCDPQTEPRMESWEQPNDHWGAQVFVGDIDLIDRCDMVVAIDWGLYGDCGTAWEIGYAYAKRKSVIIVSPSEALTTHHSVMVTNGCTNFLTQRRFLSIKDFDELFNLDYFAAGVEQK